MNGQSISTILLFIYAILAFPEIQARAQAEVDALTGKTRLPSASDASSLLYVRKIVTEVLRLSPVIPTGNYSPTILVKLNPFKFV
jgi:cytochrome P450